MSGWPKSIDVSVVWFECGQCTEPMWFYISVNEWNVMIDTSPLHTADCVLFWWPAHVWVSSGASVQCLIWATLKMSCEQTMDFVRRSYLGTIQCDLWMLVSATRTPQTKKVIVTFYLTIIVKVVRIYWYTVKSELQDVNSQLTEKCVFIIIIIKKLTGKKKY